MTTFTRADIYQPLKSPSEIRLLTLHRGTCDESIACSLKNAPEAGRPPYEALSYTWGSPDEVTEIQLNKATVSIRQNLWQALWHLRFEDEDRVLWADAICINQSDVGERNHQVKLMKTIYTEAADVAVWLGCEADESNAAMEFLHDDSDERFIVETQDDIIVHTIPAHLLVPLTKILEREYWTRMWILQEFCLASELAIYCGSKHTTWTDIEYVRRFWDWESTFAGTRASAVFWYRSKMHRGIEYTPLIDLLSKYRDRRCADPKDTIFALIGMASDCQGNEIIPDYSQSLFSIYCDVLRLYTRKNKHTMLPTPAYDNQIFHDIIDLYLSNA